MSIIESPCISVCKMDPDNNLCIGCWRTKEEIKGWKLASDDERLDLLKELHKRREAAEGKSPRPTRRRSK